MALTVELVEADVDSETYGLVEKDPWGVDKDILHCEGSKEDMLTFMVMMLGPIGVA